MIQEIDYYHIAACLLGLTLAAPVQAGPAIHLVVSRPTRRVRYIQVASCVVDSGHTPPGVRRPRSPKTVVQWHVNGPLMERGEGQMRNVR